MGIVLRTNKIDKSCTLHLQRCTKNKMDIFIININLRQDGGKEKVAKNFKVKQTSRCVKFYHIFNIDMQLFTYINDMQLCTIYQ